MLSKGRVRWSEKKKKWRFERLPLIGYSRPIRMRISIVKYGILVALIGAVLPMWSLDRVPLFYQVNSRALMPYTRSFFLFPLILRSCFSLELGFIFHVWVFNRILVFPCLNYSKFLRVPPSPQVGVNLFWSAWITGLLMVELRYCLNTVTRQE